MYLSAIDVLGISEEALLNISDTDIIRFEKLAKARFAHGETDGYNKGEFVQVIDQLRRPESRKAIYFIEKHDALKRFLQDGRTVSMKTFRLDKELLNETPSLAGFLAPYWAASFAPLVKSELAKKRYDILIRPWSTSNFLPRPYWMRITA